jgi:hypothetical protein
MRLKIKQKGKELKPNPLPTRDLLFQSQLKYLINAFYDFSKHIFISEEPIYNDTRVTYLQEIWNESIIHFYNQVYPYIVMRDGDDMYVQLDDFGDLQNLEKLLKDEYRLTYEISEVGNLFIKSRRKYVFGSPDNYFKFVGLSKDDALIII